MTDESAGLYVHFPYCVSICPYCDFDRQATGFGAIPRYVEAVALEIGRLEPRRLHSIFFGGGTPSLMEPAQVARLLGAARQRFELLPKCEITLEANPGECTEARLAGFRSAGVNRLSIGVQSLDDRTLELLGRRHSAADARAALRASRAAGFENVNLDVMLGLPGMTVERWLETVDGVVELAPEHLSCYILTVDERVPMGRDVARGRLSLPDDDSVADQYLATGERLAAAGYARYEVSNWARPGRACRHNLTYWRDEPYVGVGAGAAGWIGGLRTKNTPSPRRYITSVAAGAAERVEEERPDRQTHLRDFLALGLRLREGIDPSAFEGRFGRTLVDALGAALGDLLAAGSLEWVDGRLRVSESSILVTNEILLRLDEALDWRAGEQTARRRAAGAPSGDAGAEARAEREEVRLASGR